MMRAFSARRTSGGWRIEGAAAGTPVTDAQLAVWTADGNRRIAARLARIAPLDESWRLELEKAAFTFGRAELGLADSFAERCRAAPDVLHEITAPAFAVSRWSLMQALAAAGEPVVGLAGARQAAKRRFLLAAVVGLATWALALLKDGGGGNLPRDADDVVAVHPETTNRTGHIFRALAAAPTTPLLLLGRPTGGRSAALGLLADKGLTPAGVARPYSRGSALATLGACIASLSGGMAMAAATPTPVAFREQAAQAFRRAMGLASAHWWQRSGLKPRAVVFGHGGLADTAPLERAMQAGGTRTVHWLHGLSAGWVYDGVSDLLVTQCGHDAQWHQRLGGYGRAMAFAEAAPSLTEGGETGMVVLTNFAHPVHPTFAAHGLRDELALIPLIAGVAEQLKIPAAEVVWRPHPVLYSLPVETRQALTEAVTAAGFRLWPREDRDFAAVARFGTIVSTPSGAAVDVLRLGRLPVIAAPDPIDPDHVLAAFPLVGRTAEEIARAARAPVHGDLLAQTWQKIAPGEVPTYARVLEECGRGGR